MQDSGVGKTNILSRFANNQFSLESKPTIGVEFATKTLQVSDKQVKMQVWDTAGTQLLRFRTGEVSSDNKRLLQRCHGSTTRIRYHPQSNVRQHGQVDKGAAGERRRKHNYHAGRYRTNNAGNKSDMSDRRSVKEEEAADFAARNKLMYVEMSALLDDSNVETAFRTLVQCKTYV